MIAIDAPFAPSLFMRKPAGRQRWTRQLVYSRPPVDASTLTLENDQVRFDFSRDDSAGLRLVSFARTNGSTWTNDEPELFRFIVYDASKSDASNTSTVHPVVAQMISAALTTTPTGKQIAARWSGISVGGVDFLDVIMTIALADADDWIDVTIEFNWTGTPTRYAVDSVCVLPLRIRPKNQGSDYAVLPNIFGVLIDNPIENLRYDPADGRAAVLFGRRMRNAWNYPSGRGCKMPVWGYYEGVTDEGWMTWLEQGELEYLSCGFQSDGVAMAFECVQPQPDNMLAGNDGTGIGSSHHFCLRPFEATHGWGDVGRHYRSRIDVLAPSWLPAKRAANTNLSAIERRPFLLFSVDHSYYSGLSAYLNAYVDKLRADLGLTTADPFFGTGYFGSNLHAPYEDVDVGDDRTVIPLLFAKNVFLGVYKAGLHTPSHWSRYKWKGGQLRWWNDVVDYRAFRLSRAGALLGGGADVRAQTPSGEYYRERTYPIVSWSGITKTVTVTGTPVNDGFGTQDLSATRVPASGAVKLAEATVTLLSGSTVKVGSDFFDGAGIAATPTASDTLVVSSLTSTQEAHDECPHAILGSTSALTAIKDNALGGRFDVWRSSVAYIDTFSEPLMQQILIPLHSCYADHSDWSKIDGDYVPHPKGGGVWYRTALKTYLAELRTDVRARSAAARGGEAAYMLACEDLDETAQDIFDYCWHAAGTLYLWRDLRGEDPDANGCRGIPLFQMVHAGRSFGRAAVNEMTNALALAVHPADQNLPSPRTDDALHTAYGYFIGSEWVYGSLLPEFMVWSDDLAGEAVDLFDDTIYIAGGGLVANKVKSLRDLWASLVRAEMAWLLDAGLRTGDLLPLLNLNAATTTTTGQAGAQSSFYFDTTVVYPIGAYPSIVHAPWRKSDGQVLLLLVNWTANAATFSSDIDLADIGFQAGVAVEQQRLAADGSSISTTLLSGGSTVTLDLTAFPPFTMQAIVFRATESAPPEFTLQRPRGLPSLLPADMLTHRVDVVIRETRVVP